MENILILIYTSICISILICYIYFNNIDNTPNILSQFDNEYFDNLMLPPDPIFDYNDGNLSNLESEVDMLRNKYIQIQNNLSEIIQSLSDLNDMLEDTLNEISYIKNQIEQKKQELIL